MPTDDLINRWKAWSDEDSGPRAKLATRIATDLADEDASALWSTIDLNGEFDRTVSTSKLARFFETAESVLYLFPIFVTWFELRYVISAYRNFNPPGGESIDFLQYWAGTGGLYRGTTLPETALVVVIVVGLIGVFKIALSVSERRVDRRVANPILSQLILDTHLELARKRSVTPREMADALTTSAQQLEKVLSVSAATITTLQESSNNIGQAVNDLVGAASSLSVVTADLKTIVGPLRDTPHALDKVVSGLEEVDKRTTATIANLDSIARQTLSLSERNNDVVAQTKNLALSISQTTSATDSILRLAEKIAKTVGDVTTDIDEHQPHIVAVRSAAEIFKKATDQLQALFDEFQKSSEEYRRLVEEDRGNGRK